MTLTLNLPPQVEQAYLAEAQARGMELADVVREILIVAQPVAASPEMSPEEWIRKFEAWTRSHAGRNLPVLPDDALSRESIYADRGL